MSRAKNDQQPSSERQPYRNEPLDARAAWGFPRWSVARFETPLHGQIREGRAISLSDIAEMQLSAPVWVAPDAVEGQDSTLLTR